MADEKNAGKEVITIQKLDGTKTTVAPVEGESMKAILQRAGEYKPESFSYMLAGPGIEGGQKQVDDSLLDDLKVDTTEEILVIPKTIAG